MKTKVKDLLKTLKISKLEELLCFGSIAYCCSLDKNCPKRNLYMKINNIDNENFARLKTQSDESFKKISKLSEEVELPEIKRK